MVVITMLFTCMYLDNMRVLIRNWYRMIGMCIVAVNSALDALNGVKFSYFY